MNCDGLQEVRVSKHAFEQFELAFKTMLSDYPALYANANFESYLEDASKQIVFKFRTWLLSKTHESYDDFPKNWWEHFKQQYFPIWLLKKFPVKMKKIRTQIVKVCPHSDIKFADNRMVHFAEMESPFLRSD